LLALWQSYRVHEGSASAYIISAGDEPAARLSEGRVGAGPVDIAFAYRQVLDGML